MDSGHRRRYSREPSVLSPLNGAGGMVSPVKERSGSNIFQAMPSVHDVQTPKTSTRQTVDIVNPTKSGDETYVDRSPTPRRKGGSSRVSVGVCMSGSTFVHIDSDHEDHRSQALDASLMLSALPDLVSASDRALNTLAPADFTTQKLQRALKNPKFVQILSRLEVTFETQKEEFGPAHFIDIEAATRALPTEADANWKPELIWRKSNLARLSMDIMTWLLGSADPVTQLSRLDECFPAPFVEFSSRDDEPFIPPSMFAAGLEIRTQLCLATLRAEQDKDSGKSPSEILEDIFTWPSLGSVDELRGWSVDSLQVDMGQLPQEFVKAVTQRMDEIRAAFGEDGGQVDFEKLNSRFPRLQFAAQLSKWIRRKVENINIELAEQEPLDATILCLTEELDRGSTVSSQNIEPESSHFPEKQNDHTELTLVQSTEEQNLDLEHVSPQQTDLTLAQRIGRKLLKSLPSQDEAGNEGQVNNKGREREKQPEQAQVRQRRFNSRVLGRHIRRRYRKSLSARDLVGKEDQVNDEDHEQDQVVQGKATHDNAEEDATNGSPELGDPESSEASFIRVPYILRFLEESKEPEENAKEASSGKPPESTQKAATNGSIARRNFIDRQRGASRVSPIAGPSHFATGAAEKRPRKRGVSEIDDDSESSAFEEDRREVDVARNREQASKRARRENNNDYDHQLFVNDEDDQDLGNEEEESNRDVATSPVSERQREATVQDSDDGDDILSQGPSRQEDQDLETSYIRPRRKSWMPREEKRLTKLIGKYRTGWAAILKADASDPTPMLQDRSQVDLKDKARNLAFKHYKERKPLPPHLELLSLTRRHKATLNRLGISYQSSQLESSQRDT